MENIFYIAGVIAILFFVIKLVEMRLIESDSKKPFKSIVKDTIIVYLSVVSANLMISYLNPVIKESTTSAPMVFTDNPQF
jgi:hypothetical protein